MPLRRPRISLLAMAALAALVLGATVAVAALPATPSPADDVAATGGPSRVDDAPTPIDGAIRRGARAGAVPKHRVVPVAVVAHPQCIAGTDACSAVAASPAPGDTPSIDASHAGRAPPASYASTA